jgi:hypothetical protein
MLSLLPTELKQEVKREYRLRLASVAASLVALVGLLSIAMLLPYMAISSINERLLSERFEKVLADRKGVESGAFLEDVSRAKGLVATLVPAEDKVSVENVIERLLRVKPSTISLDSFAIARNSSSTAQVIVEGVAEDRDALLFFVQELKKQSIFKTVVLPVSNFAKAEDIEFSVTMLSRF